MRLADDPSLAFLGILLAFFMSYPQSMFDFQYVYKVMGDIFYLLFLGLSASA